MHVQTPSIMELLAATWNAREQPSMLPARGAGQPGTVFAANCAGRHDIGTNTAC